MLFVLIQRRGADGAQFAAGQRRLEQIAGVHRSFGLSRADHRVQFIDEQNHLPIALLNFLNDSLEPILKLAAIFGAGDQAPMSSAMIRLFLSDLRHIAIDHPNRQPFDDRGLSHARLANQHRIVLGPACKHLHRPADFLVAADDRIEFSLPCHLDQIAPITLEGLVLFFGILVGDALPAADFLEGVEDRVVGDAVGREISAARRFSPGPKPEEYARWRHIHP